MEWQAEDRAYRMNSESPVTVNKITTIDSIEEHMARIIAKRETLVRVIIGDKPGLNLNSNIRDLVIPIPPIAERRRILTKVEELMMLTDGLEGQLANVHSLGAELVEAIVAELTA